MIIAELVKFNRGMMKFLSENGIRISDYRYTELYDDYARMVRNHEKKEYIYAVLSEKYDIPQRTLRRIVNRLSVAC